MGSLTLRTRRDDADESVVIVSLDGELDIDTVPQLRTAGEAALAADGVTRTLALDCSDLQFLDSTGLGCWIELRNLAEDSGRSLELRALPRAARRTVTISGLAGVLGLGPGESTRPAVTAVSTLV